MRITKKNRTGERVLTFLLSCCLLFGLFPETAAAAEGTDEGALVLDKWVEEAEDGFKLTLESYATGENGTVAQKPVPLDVVLVLDESGSMADVLIYGCDNKNGTDVEVTPEGHLTEGAKLDVSLTEDSFLFVGHKVYKENVDIDKTYTVVYPVDGTTRKIYYCTECGGWFSSTNHKDHSKIARWIPFENEGEIPTESREEGGWTCTVQFYEQCGKTGRDVLQEALSSFLGKLCAAAVSDDGEPVAHRVAIVGYGIGASYVYSDGSRKEVYQDPGDGPGGSPVDGFETLAGGAWCDVGSLDGDTISRWVNGVEAEGSTPTHLGIQAAQFAFKHAPETEDENRAKVMILFTDGAPGGDYVNYGPGRTDGKPDWVTPGIQSAKEMKSEGVTIYSVGLFPTANGYSAQDISYDVEKDGQGTEGFFANANCFLHLVSSNYPNAAGVASEKWGDLSSEYNEGTKSYYLGTDSADALSEIFEQLFDILDPGSTTVTLDENAIVKDKITNDFQITYTEEAANVTAYTMSYKGEDENGNKLWEKDENSVSTAADINDPDKLHITVNGQTVSVTNFDFAGNFVHMNGDEAAGKKLVVEIGIAAADDSQGGTKLATNAANEAHTDNAGIYSPGSDKPVAEFPLPHVDLPATVTIQKVVEGSDSTEDFSFEAEYVEVGEYVNITAEESGGVNDSNYLQLKEGAGKTDTFTLKNGEIHKLENVEAGSSLRISEDAKGWIPTVTTSTGTETISPDADGKYTVTVTPGMHISFANKPETISISGSKTWDDANDQDGKRPDSITIRLYADGRQIKTATVTAEDGWAWTFENLPRYENGKEITYTITEDAVADYQSTINGMNVTNRYVPDNTDTPDNTGSDSGKGSGGGTSSSGGTSGSPGGSVTASVQSARTGDSAQILPLILVIIVSLALIAAGIAVYCRRHRKQ